MVVRLKLWQINQIRGSKESQKLIIFKDWLSNPDQTLKQLADKYDQSESYMHYTLSGCIKKYGYKII